MIPQDFIQTLLGRVDIVDVVDRYVKLKKSGANFSACCPFHNEKTPSFTVSPTKQFYHCFGCGAHGNAVGFLMEYSGQTYPDAIRTLAETVGMQVPEMQSRFDRPAAKEAQGLAPRMLDALNYYRAELKKSKVAIDYLKGRGLSGEIAARYGLGYAPEGWQNLERVFPDYNAAVMKDTGLVIDSEPRSEGGSEGSDVKPSRRYDRFRDRVMFPILDARGNVIGFGGRVIGKGEPKYLNSPETPLFEKGRELYGLYQARRAIRDANQVIVVEGYMDVVALAQHGVENAVATLGTATTPFHVSKLLRLADNVVFCFDGDEAGQRAAWRALEVSLPVLADGKTVSFLFLPPEDDPDTYVRRLGKEGFEQALASAKPLSQFLFAELAGRADMKSEEGRARFLSQAKPLIAEIQAPALSAMLRRRLAELAGLSLDEIDRLVPGRMSDLAGASQPRDRARSAAPARMPKRNAPLESKLLARILLKPELAATVPEEALHGPGGEASSLRAVLEYLRDNPGATLGQASAYFAGSEHEQAIEAALAEPLLHQAEEAELDLATEIQDIVEKLSGDQRARRSVELFRLIEADQATPEQKAEYTALQARRGAVESGNPDPEARSKL